MKIFQNAELLPNFFYKTPIRAFFGGLQTNCTTRENTIRYKYNFTLVSTHISTGLSPNNSSSRVGTIRYRLKA